MKPEHDKALLDALLGGEPWAEVSEAVKRAALAEFHARQRRRRLQFWALQIAACTVFALGGVWLARHGMAAEKPEDVVVAAVSNKIQTPTVENLPGDMPIPATNPTTPTLADIAKLPGNISEEEMLALFPEGSCIIAEIDGEKQLIFFDHKIESEGVLYQPKS